MTIKWSEGGGAPPDAVWLRHTVFVEEQGFRDEFDDADKSAAHLVLYDGEKPVGTGRLFPEQGKRWHIGRVAVLPEYRGRGVGRYLMELLEAEALLRGGDSVQLGAQLQAQEFYEKLGYEAYGEIHYEENCPHAHMLKILKREGL